MAPVSDKVQEYFASMNSLSARISSDIRAIEDTISSEDAVAKITYNAKCAAIDKYLIDDVIERNTKNRLPSGPKFIPKPNASSTNHLQALIQAMYPPKPEKYVFEEAGGVWLDEHSGPFSFCKQSQVKHCALGKNVLQNLAESEPAEIVRRHVPRNSEKKKQKPDMKNKAPKPHDEYQLKKDDSFTEIQPRGVKGVNVMDFMGSNNNGQVKSGKSATKLQERRASLHEEMEMEDKLPQQKQNLQLIAELQAKLKRSNPTEETNVDSAAEPKEPEKPVQLHKSQKKDSSDELKQAKSGKKVKKPKAPPPPPPAVAPKAVAAAPSREEAEGKNSLGRHQKMVADQLRNVMAGVKMLTHTRKNSNTNPSTASIEIPSTSKTSLPKRPTKPTVPPPPSHSKGEGKEEGKAAAGGPEFCVDVSSPCKIATPKTGLDFLDNW